MEGALIYHLCFPIVMNPHFFLQKIILQYLIDYFFALFMDIKSPEHGKMVLKQCFRHLFVIAHNYMNKLCKIKYQTPIGGLSKQNYFWSHQIYQELFQLKLHHLKKHQKYCCFFSKLQVFLSNRHSKYWQYFFINHKYNEYILMHFFCFMYVGPLVR